MTKKNKTYSVDIDFYSMEITVKAKTKGEARRKAKKMIQRKINSHINHMYIEREDDEY